MLSSRVRRVFASSMLVLCALGAPAVAAAEPLEGWILPSTTTSSSYTLNSSSGSLSFGNGATGATLPSGSSLTTTYRSGAGGTGNTGYSSATVSCVTVGC